MNIDRLSTKVFTMKHILIVFLCTLIFQAKAQTKTNTVEESDPKAKSILDKIKKQYDSYRSFEIDFVMTIEGEGKKEIQKGTLTQAADAYKLTLPNQILISDNKATWYYLKKRNEVQINTVNTKTKNEIMSPKTLLNQYREGKYIFAITGEGLEGKKTAYFIEFKPKDRNSDITKLRVAVDKKTEEIISLKTFSRDGMRVLIVVNRLTTNKKYPADTFTFNAANYPGIKVEDLRID